MPSSILTNNGAMVALQSLQMTQKNLQETQNRISTGLKVATAKDNAATWSVATSMRADIANLKQVNEVLSVSSGVVTTAATGTQNVADLISKIREAVTSVQDGVKSAKTVQASIDAYLGQIKSIVDSSSFKGVNLLNGSTSGDTKLLASVNSNGGAQTPAYITVGAQNLTMGTGGSLNVLQGFSVAGVVNKWAYSAPTATSTSAGSQLEVGDSLTFSFTLNGANKTATFTNSTAATLNMSNVDDVATVMAGIRDAINTTAGTSNQIASLDTMGRLVVDNTKGTDTIAFNGASALAIGIDSGTAITLGTATNLAPQAPKYMYAKPTGTPTASTVYDFSFNINGSDVAASYTVPSGTTSYDTVMTGVMNAINAKAGVGNSIASLDAAGNLVVDASKGKDAIAFDGATALKTQGGSLGASGAVAQKYTYTTLAALTAAAVTGDTLTFALNVNGADKSYTVSVDTLVAGSARGGAALGDYAASAAGGDALITDLATYINTLGYGSIASNGGSGATTALVIDSKNAPLGVDVRGGVSTAGITKTGTVAFAAISGNTGGNSGTTTSQVEFDFSNTQVAGDVLKFSFTQGGATKTAQVTVGATQTKAETLRALAKAINTAAGASVAAVRGDVTAEKLYVDGTRASSAVTFSSTYTNDLTGVTHASANPMTTNNQTVVSDTSYAGLLSVLKTAETAVLSAGAAFGAAQVRVDTQKDFIGKLADTLTTGVGALVDADMSEEAARLTALQTQQQLGTQALSIANQAPQSILSLFRG
ncbi:flagellin [Paracraurococcus lichenis]|uniref:Flagellin n=1 Tax=Paracraurococcus lichenis TaxID=3064888 RepID=A0ABT9E6J9_9PROT|nr:flagellin [Paracraurococcus sp. LOR1-02]MDO9711799.1 flagellin [Paracraurococcus sp. LOR1-02]